MTADCGCNGGCPTCEFYNSRVRSNHVDIILGEPSNDEDFENCEACDYDIVIHGRCHACGHENDKKKKKKRKNSKHSQVKTPARAKVKPKRPTKTHK